MIPIPGRQAPSRCATSLLLLAACLALGATTAASPVGSAGGASPALRILALDGQDDIVDWDKSNASIERTPPEALAHGPVGTRDSDPDALRFVVSGLAGELPESLRIESFGAAGQPLDVLESVQLYESDCRHGLGPACRTTTRIRTVADEVDRSHPLVRHRSIRAEVGGRITLAAGRTRLRALRVGGPRHTPVGPIARLRARLRIWMVRDRIGGRPPFGTDDATASAIARTQLRWANALWGQCGISFGPESAVDLRIVDPPPAFLLALGCDMGLPASGGQVRFRIEGKPVRVDIPKGTLPQGAARMVADAVERAGFAATVSENARTEAGAGRTADVLVRHRNGALVSLEPLERDISPSTDSSLTACIGRVELSDGLQHFTDITAPAGTVEERTLVKAFDDGAPSTIDVFMIPAFAGGSRIGESFINADKSSVRNVVIEDRAGVRADRASFALAHELGHILLDMPGHPDDFGLDMPMLLMDSDSADPSAFGPRRLTVEECARAVIESGPSAPSPLLTVWPLDDPQPAAARRP